MSFGGLGQNLFNPALVGRVFLLISFPMQMTTWPRPLGFMTNYIDAATGATPLAAMKQIVKGGDASAINKLPELWDSFIGLVGGSFGEVCAAALIFGGLLLNFMPCVFPVLSLIAGLYYYHLFLQVDWHSRRHAPAHVHSL